MASAGQTSHQPASPCWSDSPRAAWPPRPWRRSWPSPPPGCLAVVGWDPEADGALAGDLAVKVLRGRSPTDLPFEPVTKKLLLLNRRSARAIGATFPADLLRQADRLVG